MPTEFSEVHHCHEEECKHLTIYQSFDKLSKHVTNRFRSSIIFFLSSLLDNA